VPRCPPCHSEEPGHQPWVKHALRAGRKAGRHTQALHPDVARKTIGALNASLTPAQRSANGRRATAKLTPAQRSANGRQGGLRVHELHPDLNRANNARLTLAQRSANGRQGAPIANHNRWHTARGITNPVCALCRAESRAA